MKKFILSLLLALSFFGCKKNDPDPTALSLTSVTPASGTPGTEVTITGDNFSENSSDNQVAFNGVAAAVVSSTSTTLVVKVPVGGDGDITVVSPSGTATTSDFTYIPDVFIAGYEGYGQGAVGRYWKNGVAQPLTNSGDALIYSIAVVGEDVYVAGAADNGSHFIPALWKNGVLQPLTDGTHSGSAFSIATNGTDIYVCGSEEKLADNGVGHQVAKYWKNNVAVELSTGSGNARANSIILHGADIYVAGNQSGFSKYWKNGVEVALNSNTPLPIVTTSIAVTPGNDVHAVGYVTQSLKKVYLFWKNGEPSFFQTIDQNSIVIDEKPILNQVASFSNDVYMLGNYAEKAAYWKNGTKTTITDGAHNATIHSMTMYGDDVYMVGNEWSGKLGVGITGQAGVGTFWKNGEATTFTDGNLDCTAMAIVVR